MRRLPLLLPLIAVPALALAQANATTTGVAASTQAPGTVQVIPILRPSAADLSTRKASTTVSVPATGAWVDTGLLVTPADHLDLSATGTLTLADQRRCDAQGLAKGWKDLLRGLPAHNADTGALIARIGDSDAAVPFAVGGSLSEDVPSSGKLFFAANVDTTLAGTGKYTVTVKLAKATAVVADASPLDMQKLIQPSLVDSLPRRVADEQQNPGDVVNFAIVGSQAEVEKSFGAAGWVGVDKTTNDAVLHGLLSTLSKKAYLEMPMSTLFLYGRPQDMSYARAEPLQVAMVRHHLRVWNSGQTVAGRPLWVGSATHDNGLERDERNNGVTHHIDPVIDTERDFIEQSFAAAGALIAAAYAMPGNAVHDARTATGGSFQTDGRVLFMVLRGQ